MEESERALRHLRREEAKKERKEKAKLKKERPGAETPEDSVPVESSTEQTDIGGSSDPGMESASSSSSSSSSSDTSSEPFEGDLFIPTQLHKREFREIRKTYSVDSEVLPEVGKLRKQDFCQTLPASIMEVDHILEHIQTDMLPICQILVHMEQDRPDDIMVMDMRLMVISQNFCWTIFPFFRQKFQFFSKQNG